MTEILSSNNHQSNKQSGFTLVELSIVMVIMGILVAAVVGGRVLYESAQTKAVLAEIENYKIAVNNFTLQYGALPGDINKATSFWPEANTKDGNNNGKIERSEYFTLWQHLSLSKMIAGNFTGKENKTILGENVPASRYYSGGYYIAWKDKPGNWQDNSQRYFAGNYIIFGSVDSDETKIQNNNINNAEDILNYGVLKPETAYDIDMKLDNGKPNSGRVLATSGINSLECIKNNEYNFATNNVECLLFINLK